MLTDVRYAFRQIARFPGYSAVVIATLGLGIAINTQIFAIISAFFLQPLQVRESERLVTVFERTEIFPLPLGLALPDLVDLRSAVPALENVTGYFSTPAHLSLPGKTPERRWIQAVTPTIFERLGVGPSLGRMLDASDGETPPGAPNAVLVHRAWVSRHGSDPGVIGRTLIINGKPFTIVGVTQPGFEGFAWAMGVDLLISSGSLASIQPGGDGLLTHRGAKAWQVLAHRRPEATQEEVNAQLSVFADRMRRDFPDEHRGTKFQAVREQAARPHPVMSDFMPLFAGLFSGMVTLVLLIACANVANLMGSRALDRSREFIVRAAVGASRMRLIRLILIESIVLALLAGLAGYLVANLFGNQLQSWLPAGDIPVRETPPVGWKLGAFTAGISLIAGLLSGILPALRSSRINLVEGLKQGTNRSGTAGRHWMRNGLVVGQVAISCLVLACAALFGRGLVAAQNLSLGFEPRGILLVSVDPSLQSYSDEKGLLFQERLLDAVKALPGVRNAGLAQHVPFTYNTPLRDVFPDVPPADLTEGRLAVSHSKIGPGYLETMGIPIIGGRGFEPADDARSRRVVIVNEAFARRFWPGQDPLGRSIRFSRDGPPVEVVGITPTGRYVMMSEEPRPYFYTPYAQEYGAPFSIVIRTDSEPSAVARAVREAVKSLDPDLPAYGLVSFEEHMNSSIFALMPLKTGALLGALQGTIALFLAILGLYSVVSYGVTRRTREIGIRVALGADDSRVIRDMAKEGMRLTVAGLAVGLLMAAGASVLLAQIVYGVAPLDPVVLVPTAVILAGTAALACYLPARRAASVDPMVALRSE
jgi:predicted permease